MSTMPPIPIHLTLRENGLQQPYGGTTGLGRASHSVKVPQPRGERPREIDLVVLIRQVVIRLEVKGGQWYASCCLQWREAWVQPTAVKSTL